MVEGFDDKARREGLTNLIRLPQISVHSRLLSDRKLLEFLKSFPDIFICEPAGTNCHIHKVSLCENWRFHLRMLEGTQAPLPHKSDVSRAIEQAVTTSSTGIAAEHICSLCDRAFSSRNRLFQHVNEFRGASCLSAAAAAAGSAPSHSAELARTPPPPPVRLLEEECVRALRGRKCKETKRKAAAAAAEGGAVGSCSNARTGDYAYVVWLCSQPQVKRALHLLLRR